MIVREEEKKWEKAGKMQQAHKKTHTLTENAAIKWIK